MSAIGPRHRNRRGGLAARGSSEKDSSEGPACRFHRPASWTGVRGAMSRQRPSFLQERTPSVEERSEMPKQPFRCTFMCDDAPGCHDDVHFNTSEFRGQLRNLHRAGSCNPDREITVVRLDAHAVDAPAVKDSVSDLVAGPCSLIEGCDRVTPSPVRCETILADRQEGWPRIGSPPLRTTGRRVHKPPQSTPPNRCRPAG